MFSLWKLFVRMFKNLVNNVFGLNIFKTITEEYQTEGADMHDTSEDLTSAIKDEKMDLPEIYVDSNFLPKQDGEFDNLTEKNVFDKIYEIGGDTFFEKPFKEEGGFQEFRIRTEKEDSTVESTDNEDTSLTQDLDYSFQETPYGVIINSIILVTENQWHTIMFTECGMQCVVCGMAIDIPECHIKLDTHMRNLENHKPLKKYDFSIARQIGDTYHCAICNIIFDETNIATHFDSEEHEQKMLFAINRASDVLFDFQLDTNTNKSDYHFDRNRLYSVSDVDDESVDNFYEYDMSNDNDSAGSNIDISPKKVSYASVANKPPPAKLVDQVNLDLGDRNVKINFDSWNMIVMPRKNEFYCMVCVRYEHIAQKGKHCLDKTHLDKLSRCTIVDKYKQHFIRKVNDKYYHCGNCNSLQYIPDIDDHIESVHNLNKPKITQNETKINKNKEHQIEDDSKTKKNDVTNHETNVINHESSVGNNESKVMNHESNVKNHESNVINHESNVRNNESKVIHHESNVRNNESKVIHHESSDNRMQINPMTLSSYSMSVNKFHSIIRVSLISYNMVCQRPLDYYCGICSYASSEFGMRRHINEVCHIETLARIPFEVYFGINLIRRINNFAHCTICNVVFDVTLTHAHVVDQMHCQLLRQAVIKVPQGIILPNIAPRSIMNQTKAPANIIMNQRNESTSSMNHTNDVNDSKLELNESNVNQLALKSNNTTVDANDSKLELNESSVNDVDIKSYNEDYLYLKFKNTYAKVTFKSYNSLLNIGDGTSFCFVCSERVFGPVRGHIESDDHMECLNKYHFIDKYDKHLLRQISYKFHCCNCNIMFMKSELPTHLAWPGQIKIDKKIRKIDFKSGIKHINIKTTPESIVTDEPELQIEILLRVDLKSSKTDVIIKKSNKIIIFNGNSVKVSWDAWQSLCKNKNGYRCQMCQMNVKNYDVNRHISDDKHRNLLDSTFERKFLPSLLRKINDNILNCVTCNTEVSSKDHLISDHINGKKHKKHLNIIKECDMKTNGPNDVLNL